MTERTLHRDYYWSAEIFGEEKERIFCREWFCGGREEELARPGDYLILDVAGESIIVVRTREGLLRAHYNVCRHRGSRLVQEGCKGSFTGGIRCPYHSWTYTLDGKLRTAPFLDDADGLNKADLGLYPVGVESWGGFFFLHLTPKEAEAQSHTLEFQLGAIPERLSRYPLQELRSVRRTVYDVAANWKVILENYNECYHCGPVHPELCRLVPAFKQRGGSELDWERGIPHREGAWTFTETGTSNRRPFAGLNQDELVRHKGELVYPNFMTASPPTMSQRIRCGRGTQVVPAEPPCTSLEKENAPDEARSSAFPPCRLPPYPVHERQRAGWADRLQPASRRDCPTTR